MMNQEHFKDFHHAYLLEGPRDEILREVLALVKEMEVTHIDLDVFKIEDARNLKSYESLMAGPKKKAFVISANTFLFEAQNTLLKILEDPIPDTHFFVIVPDAGALLKTFISRFYLIRHTDPDSNHAAAEKFLKMSYLGRIDFIKSYLDDEVPARANAVKFINSLEFLLSRQEPGSKVFHHLFKVREFLRVPGSSVKMLLESVALLAPVVK